MAAPAAAAVEDRPAATTAGATAGALDARTLARLARAQRRARIQQIRQRLRVLGLSVYAGAQVIGVSNQTLHGLLAERYATSTALGYDRWPETVLARLDAYEDAAIAARPAVEEAIAQFQLRGVNPPARLVAMLMLGKAATTPRGKATRATRKTTAATTARQQKGA